MNQPAFLPSEPLLGTAARASYEELRLASQIDELHQIIYSKGGLNSTNAAIEELSKLIFLRLCVSEQPAIFADISLTPLDAFTDPTSFPDLSEFMKAAFAVALTKSERHVTNPRGEYDSIWPEDEPFRVTNNEVLVRATQIVNDIATANETLIDPLGTAFDAFLSGKYDHSGGLGTYLTPSAVARFMAEVVLSISSDRPRPGGGPWLMDPFCGTGRFLVAGYQALVDSAEGHHSNLIVDTAIYGADQSASAVAKTALNLMLYGAQSPHTFTVSDSIGGNELDSLKGQVPLILTNPPFGGGKYDDHAGIKLAMKYFEGLSPTKIDPAIGGLARCLDLLTDDGVLGIVLPDGIVNGRAFTQAMTDGRLKVVASVGLPTATFSLSGTVARTSAVFIQKSQTRDATVLARADHVGFIKKAGKPAIDPEGSDLLPLASLVPQALQQGINGDVDILSSSPLVAVVKNSALTSIDPARFDSDAMNGKAELLRGAHTTISAMCTPQKAKRVQGISHDTPFVSVLHVDAYSSIDWVLAEDYKPSTPGRYAEGGDIIISLLNPSKLRVAVVPHERGSIQCSAEFGVLSGAEYPYAVLALLHDPRVAVQLRPLGTGTSSSRRRISITDVGDLIIPQKSKDELSALNDSVRSGIELMEKGRLTLGSLFGGPDHTNE